MKSSWNIAIGFYQNFHTVNSVLAKLKQAGFHRVAYIHRNHHGKITYKGSYLYRVDSSFIERLKPLVISDEIVVVVQIEPQDSTKALEILRHVETGHPASFLLKSLISEQKEKLEITTKPLTIDELDDQARILANSLKEVKYDKRHRAPLLKNLKEYERSLNEIRYSLSEAELIGQTITLSAEWLLDNIYVIQGNIDEVLKNLPPSFYQELPQIKNGPYAGLPRVYVIAKNMVHHTANRLTRENIIAYLNSYQSVDPLTIAELWTLPLMLRLRLIECLNVLSQDIVRRIREGEYAYLWGNRLLNVSKREPDRIQEFLTMLQLDNINPSSHFAEELIDHLYDEEQILPSIRQWIESKLHEDVNELIKQEQLQKTTEQIAISSAIISLITISQLSWREIFEKTSIVDQILNKDPQSIYSHMDFNSRDSYRHAIEELARGSPQTETEIASMVLQKAEHGKNSVDRHVGYYLIDQGRLLLEKSLNYKPTWGSYLRSKMTLHSTGNYLGAVLIVFLFIMMALGFLMDYWNVSIGPMIAFLILSLIPASEIAIQFVNLMITKILQPMILPKMCYDEGVPKELKTLVVIPSLLVSEQQILKNIHSLEVYYLANSEEPIRFGLYYDFTDAPQEQMPNDPQILNIAIDGIKKLEEKYGKGRFFIFYRNRSWSPSERAWIGRERKRGKLESLNRFLVEKNCPETILALGNRENLNDIRYVITLDADTELPKDAAKELIATISHPLNAAQLNNEGWVERGYTIIQPRVGTDITHCRDTLFAKIFADARSINPYTQAISDVYQDMMSEGNYHGKGIYDVQTFHHILCHRFPKEHLLSHDLLEGAHVRVGFASDIALSDAFPKDYYAWSKRNHRWMRGDWQIIDWLFPYVKGCDSDKVSNPLSAIGRWKIFDNIRRSLLPISLFLLLLVSFFFSQQALFWACFVLFVFFLPPIRTMIFNSWVDIKRILYSRKDIGLQSLRSLINTALVPLQAYLSLDVVGRVFFRRLISHQHLLEWETFSPSSSSTQHRKFLCKLWGISLFAVLAWVGVLFFNPSSIGPTSFFCILWFISPWIIAVLDKPRIVEPSEELLEEERLFLRKIARKTWRYFDDFVGPQTNWLPPDNYQAALTVEVAQRTSPTNIGLWMLSVLSAYDFKYITIDDVIERLLATFQTFKKLEMYEGHFLNWYDIQSLKPLYPRYVSTVDSGNLLASFWALEQGIYQVVEENLLPATLRDGLKDTLRMIFEYHPYSIYQEELDFLNASLSAPRKDLSELISFIRDTLRFVQESILTKQIEQPPLYWFKQVEEQLVGWKSIADRYYSWIDVINLWSEEELQSIDPNAAEWKHEIFKEHVSLKMLAFTQMPEKLQKLLQTLKEKNLLSLYKPLNEAIQKAQWLAGEKMGLVHQIVEDNNSICAGLNMSFLYNEERKLFSIGYHVDNCQLDTSYYDLLASEARIASFVAIAKDDVPLEHWWALGRPFGYLYGKHPLMSWGGTMFEYLMPLLFKNLYPDTLIEKASRDVVSCQMTYAERRGIPWGISEAAFSAIDAHKIYQYRSFGVPGLGFKRGLEEDLVVSPYSTALALAVDPKAAIKNMQRLSGESQNMLGEYGYFESIDYTRQHAPHGERGVIVYAYMAHHQGMSLLAIGNVLHHNILRKRFHANPRVIGMESLLSERAPVSPAISKGSRKTIPISRLTPFSAKPIMGMVDTPHTGTPKVNLLSNGVYSVMMTNSGGGYSSWKDLDITRWRADTTRDNWGSFIYIKDVQTGYYWSTTYHPTHLKSKKYSVSFKADKTEIWRTDYQIESGLEIIVSPEDDAEVRLLTLANLSKQKREIELTSYYELALAPHAADAAHPCFNKMFIETEALPDLSGLIAFRRLRSPDDRPVFAGHVISSNTFLMQDFQFETDRDKFIGRGNDTRFPNAMNGNLSNSQGYVLDPIFSLRHRVILTSGQRIQIAFVMVISDNREKTMTLLKKYGDIASSHRAIEMAWAHAQLELRHLRIHQEEVQLYQKLASKVLYPHVQLRPSSERLLRNKRGQSNLWAYGISGDLPIVVATVADVHEMELVKQALTAHVFWNLRGLKTDLVILNDESSGYERPLYEELQRVIQTFSGQVEAGKSGGVYLLNVDQIPEEDLILILSVARANLIAARGTLRQQLVAPLEPFSYPPHFAVEHKSQESLSAPLPFVALEFFNDVGGMSSDGREYMIYLKPGVQTPAPWVNVIANPQFGTLVSESGMGTTWFGNSQTNRLTPWSNDPVSNPISDTLYIRDNDLGVTWTPTPAPIRELDPYRVRHGQGYTRFEHNSHGIEQDLLVFVPVDDAGGMPVRIQKLTLRNGSPKKRNLCVYSYCEWVLGVDKEKSQMHVITEWDAESQSIFARNRYHPDYADYLAFSCSLPLAKSYTANRMEFLGRNGLLTHPAALRRTKLSNSTGAALDPCAALHVNVELEPWEEKELFFFLGYAPNEESAREMINNLRGKNWVQKTYWETLKWWDKFLGTLHVETPDPLINSICNRWLPYQNLSCRFWGRTAFYQSSGAYGFRDQLQDAMTLVYAEPHRVRDQILLAAAHQFVEGDVQHWWHPPSNGGVRTRISDDLLWLPYVTAQYIRVTQDFSILDEEVSFIKGEILKENEHEAYFVPEVSEEKATILEHCRRALKKGLTEGPHGLPLIGGGDWNDGMNRVGIEGRGESVWLAWFLIHVMHDFADLLSWSGQSGSAVDGFRAQAKRLGEVIEQNAWDGRWYRRAYFDDGTPLGSSKNSEDMIDALPQAWAVISQAGNPERVDSALQAVEEFLIKYKEKMILLLTPSFDQSPLDPGYIKGYPPGVRENGGQYTHGSLWIPLAYAMRGDGDKAVELIRMMHPLSHSSTKNDMMHFKTEPYVLAADIYSLPGQVGRGGWTWYTGSSGWMYRILIENVFGFTLRGNKLSIVPALPKGWNSISLRYQYQQTTYNISIENTPQVHKGNMRVELDGVVQNREEFELVNDGKDHQVKIKSK